MIRVILADDHQVVREALRPLLEAESNIEVVGEAKNGIEAVRLAGQLASDVLVTDVSMSGMDAREVARSVSRSHPETRVVILSMHSDESYVLEALRNGAMAYVLKESAFAELLDAIRAAAEGRRYLSRSLSNRAIERYATGSAIPPDPHDHMTTREREVLHLAAEGASAAEVARRLLLSRRTVETYRAAMMRKLGLANQTELVRYAIRRGILPVD